jgi:hypothetical protein
MPFRSELNFFYLYIQRYLETQHGLVVRRGDTSILTKALMEKIEAEIQGADFIIGDVTYSNPNVFYELGIARAARKPIIFLTQDEPEATPVDLRQFEFIKYELSNEKDFIVKLDNAVRNLSGADYRAIYGTAIELLRSFNVQSQSTYGAASFEEFQARVMRAERLEGIPEGAKLREFLLPKVIAEATDIGAIRKMEKWLTQTGAAPAGRSKRAKKLER